LETDIWFEVDLIGNRWKLHQWDPKT